VLVVIDNQVFPGILRLLQNQQITEPIMKEACWTISNITAGTKEQVQVKITLDINNNNNNNNLFLRSLPSQHTKLVYEPPCLWDKGPPTSRSSQHTKLVYEIPLFVGQGTPSPRPRDLTGKVYTYPTLPPFGFDPVTS
jgi:hypothetical protein